MPRILLVDDDMMLSGVLAKWFVSEGHEIDVANDGDQGLQMLGQKAYDVLLLDWDMPGKTGVEVLKTFRDQGGKTPAIMLTGKDSIEHKEQGLDAGADDYLVKPFHLKELSARVRSAVRRGAPPAPEPRPQRKLKAVCLECCEEFPENITFENCPKCLNKLEFIAGALSPGSSFADKYEIVDLLGMGGLGTVYKIRHKEIGKQFALKLIHSQLATKTQYVQRFKREAQAISKLSHPNIVGVIDFGISPEGEAYLVLEYIEGKTLSDIIEERGRLEWKWAVPMFLDVCQGVGHGHEQGIVHRDLKPGNIMISQDAARGLIAKVVDFGLAKESHAASSLTSTGDIIGSPTYMSPEQCRGGQIDHRSDIYSMGTMMYHMVVGSPPFVGTSIAETLYMHTNSAPQPIPESINVPPWLQQTIYMALEKDPQYRQQSMRQLWQQLREGWQFESQISNWTKANS